MARNHTGTLRAREPGAKIETRWCPSHQSQTRLHGKEVGRRSRLAEDEDEARTASTDPARSRSRIPRWGAPTNASRPVFTSSRRGTLHLPVTPVDHATCWCQYKIQTREHLFKNCLTEDPLGHRPEGYPALPGGGTAPRSQSCRKDGRPTGGRRRRSSG